MKSLSEYRSIFSGYISQFYCDDDYLNKNFRIKENHTERVYKNILSIAKSLDLNDNDTILSGIIALFHDIGRFEQFRKYKTFNDGASEDHAALGVKIIREQEFFSSLNSEERSICLKAINFHNKKDLFLKRGSGRIVLFTRLIRDADKLDILGVLSNYYESDDGHNPALVLDLPEKENFSENILNDFLNRKKIDSKDLKSRNDFKLLLMSWIFDLNFRFTKTKIREKRYFEKILDTVPDCAEKEKINEVLKEEFV